MDFPIRATMQYLGDHIEALFQAHWHCKQLFLSFPALSLSRRDRRSAQPSQALLQPALDYLCPCQRVRLERNRSTWRQSSPADRRVAETTVQLAEHTVTPSRNR